MSEAPATKPKKVKINSRWRKGAVRFDTKRTVEATRSVRGADGHFRKESDSPTEAKFVERAHEQPGWHRGAKVTKK